MHYRNGREANNGDIVVKLDGAKIVAFGVLHDTSEDNGDFNGSIAFFQVQNDDACVVDCLHADDVAAMVADKGLDKRPTDK